MIPLFRSWKLPVVFWSCLVPLCLMAAQCPSTSPAVDQPAAVSSEPAVRRPAGYYAMTPGRGTVLLKRYLQNKNLAGVELRDTWANINPSRGKFDFSRLRALVKQVQQAGKQYTLVILAGDDAPRWLAAEGVEYLAGIPLPWDRRMLGFHDAMLEALAGEFGADPALVKVNAGGPTHESLELYLPVQILNRPGAFANLVGAWTLVATSYRDHFPGVAISFNLSAAVRDGEGNQLTAAASKEFRGVAADKLARAVADAGYRILGARFVAQHDHLNAKPAQETDPIHKLLLELGKQGRYIGFEQVCSSSDSGRYGGTFATSDARVKRAGGKFFDIYQPDDALVKLWK